MYQILTNQPIEDCIHLTLLRHGHQARLFFSQVVKSSHHFTKAKVTSCQTLSHLA